MKNTKFRAWDKENGMLYSFCIHSTGLIAYINQGWLPDNKKPILMQFTGMIDKNGKEIYEEDVVKAPWGLVVVDLREFWYMAEEYWSFKSEEDYEIIGNVYDNPELLRVG